MIKVGDIVVANGGGPEMIVMEIKDNHVKCRWSVSTTRLVQDWFDIKHLKRIEEQK